MFGVRAYSCAASAMEAKSIQAIMTTDPSTGKQPERRQLVGVMIMFGIRAYSYVCCSRGDEGQVECGPPNRHATAEPALGKESRRGQSWASGNTWRRLFFYLKSRSTTDGRTDRCSKIVPGAGRAMHARCMHGWCPPSGPSSTTGSRVPWEDLS